MPLDDTFLVSRLNQRNGGTDSLELIIEQFTGMVEGTLNRVSKLKGWVPVQQVQGTSTIRMDGVGESQLQVLQPGVTPDGTRTEFGKAVLTIDTIVLARAVLGLLDLRQTNFEKRAYIADEHGKKLGKLWDQAMFIQAVKASQLANSRFHNAGNELDGHSGGSIETLTAAGDKSDPAKLYAALARLLTKMELKDVDPQVDGCVLAVKPDVFYTLLQSEQLINSEYITSAGNSVKGMMLAAYGIPVIRSNNYPAGENITAHPLSTAVNGNGYNGDFTKVVATVMAPRSLFAGETIPLTTETFYDQVSKAHFVDAHMSYGATPGRAEFAGSIVQP